MVTAAIKLEDTWKESSDKPTQPIKKQKHQFSDKCLEAQSYGLSSSHVRFGPEEKAEHQRVDAFKLWCWRRILTVS